MPSGFANNSSAAGITPLAPLNGLADGAGAAALAKIEKGALSDIYGGAAAAPALRLAERSETAGDTTVVVLPASGERHLGSAPFEGMFDAGEIAA